MDEKYFQKSDKRNKNKNRKISMNKWNRYALDGSGLSCAWGKILIYAIPPPPVSPSK